MGRRRHKKFAIFQCVNGRNGSCGVVMPRGVAMGHATNYMSCRCSYRIGSDALFRMKKLRAQPLHLDRRALLRAGAGILGAAALAPVLPRLALAETAQAAQLTDSDKADIARIED